MNQIEHLKGVGRGKRVFMIGNGPSLDPADLDQIKDEDSIAMNRIAMIYPKTLWRPSYYVFSSDNCRHYVWGGAWSRSIHEAAWEPKTQPLIWERYREEIEARSGVLPSWTVFLDSITEHGAGREESFSKNADVSIDKSGTTMNVALQLAFYMEYDEVYLLGCDSNWETATNTPGTGDPNHFDADYHASIADGPAEFVRMNDTHKVARIAFDEAGRTIMNLTKGSALTAYETGTLEEVVSV